MFLSKNSNRLGRTCETIFDGVAMKESRVYPKGICVILLNMASKKEAAH